MTTAGARAADTSVIMTCFNERAYVETALASVLNQTAADRIVEIVVVDDGSSDGSAELIEAIAKREPKVTLVKAKNGGVAAARNLALDRIQGELVAFLDGDDIWLPDKLEHELPVFDRYPEVGLVYSDFYEFTDAAPDDQRRVHARSYVAGHGKPLADYYLLDAPVIPSTMVVRRTVFALIGGFNTELRVGEDTEICLRIAEQSEFHHIALPLARKRLHASSLSSQQDRLWPNHIKITEQFADRNPTLKALAGKRLSRRAAKVGWGMVQFGDRRRAAIYLGRALRYDPLHVRAYFYLALALLPRSLALKAHRFAGSLQGSVRTHAT
jgi:glycosyltransferase involved in cell wall biosynthesis